MDTLCQLISLCTSMLDILVHSGDFGKRLRDHEFDKACKDFNKFLRRLPHRHKVFVAGNHVRTWCLWVGSLPSVHCQGNVQEIAFNAKSREEIQTALSSCIYLQDEEVTIEGCGSCCVLIRALQR